MVEICWVGGDVVDLVHVAFGLAGLFYEGVASHCLEGFVTVSVEDRYLGVALNRQQQTAIHIIPDLPHTLLLNRLHNPKRQPINIHSLKVKKPNLSIQRGQRESMAFRVNRY